MKKLFLLLCFGVFIFVSCDPHSDYKKEVVNNFDYIIKIIGYSNPTGIYKAYDSFMINPNSQTQIRTSGLLGNNAPPCVIKGDSLVVILPNNKNLKIVKDLNKVENWQREQTGSNAKGYFINCKASISNADIVPQ